MLKKMVKDCLEMSTSRGHQSITFPALGTGNLRYPVNEVAKAMIEAMIEYVEGNPDTTIHDVRIVIYNLDKKTLQVCVSHFL